MNNQNYHNDPIIIIAAPRSGTKMLRETLHLHPLLTGPKYELERVWCKYNMHRYNMPLTVENLTPKVIKFIRKYFAKLAENNPGKKILAKSTLLPLRVRFLREVFPQAPVIHIIRDGRDSACSIAESYIKCLELKYLLRNRVFPHYTEIPYFFLYWLKFKLGAIFFHQKRVKNWGPQFDDMDELWSKYNLLQVAGIQWNRSIMGIIDNKQLLEEGPYFEARYENLVDAPEEYLKKILDFLQLPFSEESLEIMRANIFTGKSRRWQRELSENQLESLLPHISEGLKFYGYI